MGFFARFRSPKSQVARVESSRSGILAALASFFLWGVLPLFWKALDFLPSTSIVAQRTLWSLLVLGIVLGVRGQTPVVRAAFRSPQLLAWHLLAGTLLAANWLIYVWATLNGRILEGALGYYLNPFFNVLFGVLWFGERHPPTRLVAIAIALCGVMLQIPAVGGVPWISLVLALTFALYAVVRKRTSIEALPGLALETTLLAPIALGWLLVRHESISEAFGGSAGHAGWVIATGIATAVPLLCFGHAARRLSLATLGILQFLGPTLQFLIGWGIYHEPLSALRLASFALIWLAVGLYALDVVWTRPQRVAPRL